MEFLASHTESAAAMLQAVITAGLAILCAALYRRHRKPYFLWWSIAWGLYVLRIVAIITFLGTGERLWLYWHQVLAGWIALALLWAALVFSQQTRWRPSYLAAVLFPPLWSYVAIYRLDHFLWAAGPAVLFLSLSTLWTGWVFLQHHRTVGSSGAALLAGALLLWGLHHLDYPMLRARGAWSPWGYYLDIVFILAVGSGILLLVIEELRRGVAALSALSGDLQPAHRTDDVTGTLLQRPLDLPGVRGSALYLVEEKGGVFTRGVGACAAWSGQAPTGSVAEIVARVVERGRPELHPYVAVLPIFRGAAVAGALIIVGQARDPFTALDESFLIALGQQVGGALENSDLYLRLQARTGELERLATRMVQQHEEERRRLSLELHDETAQVFSAVKLELGVLQEGADPAVAQRLGHVLRLVDAGMRSIRGVTNDLRPPLLDELGLLPALRALVTDFGERSGLAVQFAAIATLPPLRKDAELALFRALQEALSNVARHAAAGSVAVEVATDGNRLLLSVEDDGRGLPLGGTIEEFERNGHLGLTGMRERIAAVGGSVHLNIRRARGVRLELRVPAHAREPA